MQTCLMVWFIALVFVLLQKYSLIFYKWTHNFTQKSYSKMSNTNPFCKSRSNWFEIFRAGGLAFIIITKAWKQVRVVDEEIYVLPRGFFLSLSWLPFEKWIQLQKDCLLAFGCMSNLGCKGLGPALLDMYLCCWKLLRLWDALQIKRFIDGVMDLDWSYYIMCTQVFDPIYLFVFIGKIETYVITQ